MKKFLLSLGLAAALGAAHAQEATPAPTPLTRGTWTFTSPDGVGEYIVRLDVITSVSIHEYILDGAVRVTEANIATLGSELVRFYYVEPNKPKAPNGIGQSSLNAIEEKAKEALTRANVDDLLIKVVKNYPTTTHAHTVEFRVASKEILKKVYESAKDSWINKKAATFKP